MILSNLLSGCLHIATPRRFLASLCTLFGLYWNIHCSYGIDAFVNTSNGYIRGFFNTSTNITEFKAIPYAKKPIGKLRFVPPVPIDPWTGIYDATKAPAVCMQRTHPVFNRNLQRMSEDCLYLNIYVPDMVTSQSTNSTSKFNKPVMIWIHSGGFMFGNINSIDFTLLCRQTDIIIVVVAYRLDIFGFLSFHHKVLPGNAGLLDQKMAINWVKTNILSFGGDPSKITIYGESSGASSVLYHIASPLTEGLFQRAIIGSASFIQGKNQYEKILEALTMVDCERTPVLKISDFATLTVQENTELLRCFQKQKAQRLINITLTFPKYTFVPIVDHNYVPHSLKYAFKNQIIQKRDVACLIGINKDGFPVRLSKNVNSRHLFETSLRFLNLMRSLEDHVIIVDDRTYRAKPFNIFVKNAILSKYLPPDDSYRRALLNAFNGKYSIFIQRLLPKITRAQKYFYYFTPRPSFARHDDIMAAANTDELPFVFGQAVSNNMLNATNDEKKLSVDMMNIWGSFISFGVPQLPNNIKWPVYESTNKSYVELSLNITEDNVKSRLKESDWIFWNNLIPNLAKISAHPSATTNPPMKRTTMHHMNMGSDKIAWGMEDQMVHDLLMGLLVASIFLFAICVTLIVILYKLRTLKIKHHRPTNGIPYNSSAKLNEGYVSDTINSGGTPIKIDPESVTKF